MAEIINVFNFLKDYNEISNPVITDITKQKWSMSFKDIPKIKEIWSAFAEGVNDEKILDVIKPVLLSCPIPDEMIIDWIEGDWKDLHIDAIKFIEEKTKVEHSQAGDIEQIEQFSDNDKRVNAFTSWIEERNEWLNKEIPKEKGLEIYNKLFKLHSEIKRESESVELVLGDGNVVWKTLGISHPVLLQKVKLIFDPDVPKFTINCEESDTELYTSLFRTISSVDQSILSDVIKDVEENNYYLTDTINTSALFNRLINVVDKTGRLVEEYEKDYTGPMIKSDPMLFLRKRNLGYSLFIEKIIEEIKSNESLHLPDFFNTMIGKYDNTTKEIIEEESWNFNGIDEDILLTLPANNDQMRIIKYLNHYGAVLVQGPPGTGKTHTIANLIGHLLSEGNNVLVTSHTEKALTVLKDKVYKDEEIDLQSLCISLLSSKSQKEEMDKAINEMAIKSTSLDLNKEKEVIKKLTAQRKNLIEDYKKLRNDLISVRSQEYKDLVFDNQTIKPIEAAKFISEGIDKYDFLEGNTTDCTVNLPLSEDELIRLSSSNDDISEDEERMLSKKLPLLGELWTVEEFEEGSEKLNNLQSATLIEKPILRLTISEKDRLNGIKNQGTNILNYLINLDSVYRIIISKVHNDKISLDFWKEIIEEFDSFNKDYQECRRILFNDSYEYSKGIVNNDTIRLLNEIISTGKEKPITKMSGLTKPRWKKLRDSITINDKNIEFRNEFVNLKTLIEYEIKKSKVIDKIYKLLDGVIARDDLSTTFENKIIHNRESITYALNFINDIWLKYLDDLSSFSENQYELNTLLSLDGLNPVDSIEILMNEKILPSLSYYTLKLELQEVSDRWDKYLLDLESYDLCDVPVANLIKTIKEKNSVNYRDAVAEFEKVITKRDIFEERNKFLSKLGTIAPSWSAAIQTRIGIHGKSNVPKHVQLAWKRLQLSNQIRILDEMNPNRIQNELNAINDLLLENSRNLAYRKAWYHNIKNRTQEQTSAIESWRTTIKQIGKGTGKKAPIFKQKAREIMPKCQSAIPVWIMSLNHVVENFDPQSNNFDVVIIDEASQSDILSLSALFLGKRIIIVGDDEQVSPESGFVKTDDIRALVSQHLQGIPHEHLYNNQTSLYDMAKMNGFKPLMLSEHFRCLPEIIEFSNQLSYRGMIDPLRDNSAVRTVPPVVEYRVPSGIKERNKVNFEEAQQIVSLICACIEEEEYQDKTIGIISMLGTEQAYAIDSLLQTHIDPVEYENRKIQCGTPPQFQGDERDIIFLSIVEGPTEKGGPVRLLSEDGNNDKNRKRYNVAASRAKDQMWVVHSLNPEIDLKPDDIRLRLIKHAIHPEFLRENVQLEKTESDFEYKVMLDLINKGYRVISQWKVGSYRIDMVIEDGDKRIALECDGGRWHTIDNLPDDIKRQNILERLGWTFIRIRSSEYYRYPEETMKKVVSELTNFGIKPNYSINDEAIEVNQSNDNELLERIKRKANNIRMRWKQSSNQDGDTSKGEEYVDSNQEEKIIQEEKVYNVIDFQQSKVAEEIAHVDNAENRYDNSVEQMSFTETLNQKPLFEDKYAEDTSEYSINTNNNQKTDYKFDFTKKRKINEKKGNVGYTLYADLSGKIIGSFSLCGKEIEVDNWKQLYILTCRELVKINKDIFYKCIESKSMKAYFSHNQLSFRSSEMVENTRVYASTSISQQKIKGFLEEMLRAFNIHQDY